MDEKIGQVAVWIILAIILVAAMILFFTLGRETNIVTLPSSDMVDPRAFMERCTAEYVNNAADKMLLQGGFVYPKNTIRFNNTNIEYICENVGFYSPCINQHPLLLKEMEKEIRNNIYPFVTGCFDELKREVEKRKGEIDMGALDIDVELSEDRIFVDLIRDIEITKRDATNKYDKFDIVIASPLYNLGAIAIEIASQEAQYCYFESTGYSVYYPRYRVVKYAMSEPVRIYTIKDEKSGKEMNIAIRSCAMPPGI